MEAQKTSALVPKVTKKNEYIAPSVIHDQLAKINDRIHSVISQEAQNNRDLTAKLNALATKLSELEIYIKKPWYKR